MTVLELQNRHQHYGKLVVTIQLTRKFINIWCFSTYAEQLQLIIDFSEIMFSTICGP